ncbi:MAG: hypothetical protein CMJ64_18290 [Planctomycetaceae bacterium]|nr:hypothetical protein [Planctomycetaceae bacterium]
MDVAIKIVAERNGQERFVLVNASTREVLTVNDVSEPTLRRFFQQRGANDDLISECLDRARLRRGESARQANVPVNQASETMGDDDLLLELGLDDD